DPFLEQEAAKGKDQDKGPLESGIVQQPPEKYKKPAVQFFDWDSKSYKEKDPFLVQSEKELKSTPPKDGTAAQQEAGLTSDVQASAGVKFSGFMSSATVTLFDKKPVVVLPNQSLNLFLTVKDSKTSRERHHMRMAFDNELRVVRRMHFVYLRNICKSIFIVTANRLYCGRHLVESLIVQQTGDPYLLNFLLKASWILDCARLCNNAAVRRRLIYNNYFLLDASSLDNAVVDLINCMQPGSTSRLRVCVPNVYDRYMRFSPRIIHNPQYFRRLLSLLCRLVNMRLCVSGTSEEVLDFAIVNLCIMFGCMYSNYANFAGLPVEANIEEIIDNMKSSNLKRGVLGRKCFSLFMQFSNVYGVVFNNANTIRICDIDFPPVLLQQCSEHFAGQVEHAVASGSMGFHVVMQNISMQLCMLVDKMSIAACEEEISAYAEIYDRMINSSNVGEDKGQQR
ncbi:DUF3514 domain-containing protein, partial [Ehrlichia minasensis]